MSEKTLVSTFTLIGSLASYYYGKANSKDVVPYVMIGGFVGAWVGELIANNLTKNADQKKKKNGNHN
jgi:uncharacterized membrane protein YeaQ/YmgE (transglycosylase-associated protein family)